MLESMEGDGSPECPMIPLAGNIDQASYDGNMHHELHSFDFPHLHTIPCSRNDQVVGTRRLVSQQKTWNMHNDRKAGTEVTMP